MSKTRVSSALSAAGSLKDAPRQSSGWRIGASRPPSRLPCVGGLMREGVVPLGVPVAFDDRGTASERYRALDGIQSLLEAVGMRALGFRQRLEPISDLGKAFIARRARHAWVHIGVLVGFARNRCTQVQLRLADRQPGGRIAHLLEVLEVPMRVAGFALGGRTEHRRYVVVTFDVGLRRKIQVTPVRLGFARESVLQALFSLAALQIHDSLLKLDLV